MAYVRQIEPAEATGELKEFYDKLIERDGCVRGIFKLSSLRPSVLFGLSALYEAVFYGPSGLSRGAERNGGHRRLRRQRVRVLSGQSRRVSP